MDRVRIILRYQWVAYWRRYTRAGRLRLGDQGVWLLLTLLLAPRYVRLLQSATSEVAAGETTRFEQLLAGIFLAWMFPLLTVPHLSISTQGLRHLPLSLGKLFAIRIASLFIPLSSCVIVGGSLGICLPLAHTPNPLAGMIAAFLFMTLSFFTATAIAHLMSLAVWRRVFASLAVAGVGTLGLIWLATGKDVQSLLQLQPLLPGHFVSQAAFASRPGTALGDLAILTAFAGGLALYAFRQNLGSAGQDRLPGSQAVPLLTLPGRWGGLTAKDSRYFFRLLDPYLGFLIAALCVAYLASAEPPSSVVVLLFITLVFMPNASLAFNSLGLDTETGMARYALLPISGATLLLSKNVAFALVVGVQLVAIIILAGWHLGPSLVAIGLLQAGSMTLAYLTYGNWVSVTDPFKMRFYRFASGGSPFEALVGLIVGSLPGVVTLYLPRENVYYALWKMVALFLLCALFYILSLRQSGKKFERTRESFQWRLS